MDYCSLEEAAAEIGQLPGSPRFTAKELLRQGVAERLIVCAPLDTRAYSPTVSRRLNEPARASAEDPQGIVDRATVEMLGLYAIPSSHLFEIEARGSACLQVVRSLDGVDVFFPNVLVSFDQLRLTRCHLSDFIKRCVLPADAPAPSTLTQKEWQPAKLKEMHRHRSAGMSDAAIGKKFGISRQRVSQLIGTKTDNKIKAQRKT